MRLKNLVVNFVVVSALLVQVNDAQFTNQWAVDIDGGQSEADRVAKETGCTNQGKKRIFIFLSIYLQLLITIIVFFDTRTLEEEISKFLPPVYTPFSYSYQIPRLFMNSFQKPLPAFFNKSS